MEAGPRLLAAFSSVVGAVVAPGVAELILVLGLRVDVVARVLLTAVKAEAVPALGVKTVEVTTVVLGASVDEGEAVVLTTTTEEDEVVEVVVGATEVLVGGAWEVEVEVETGTGGSEVRAPVTPCLTAQSPRFMPLGQQKVSAVGSWVQ